MNPTHAARPHPQDDPPDTWAEHGISADMRAVVGPLSFWRIINIPFGTWVTALERWQLSGHGSELPLGESLLRGPAKYDQHFGTCRIEVLVGRGPLRPPLRMRLDIDHWSATSTAVALIPCQRVRPSAAYFQAGRRLLDSLTSAVPAHSPVGHVGGAYVSRPPTPEVRVLGGPAAGSAAIPAHP
jgi:hypothetical protein